MPSERMGKFSQEPPDGLYEDVISALLDEKLQQLKIAGRVIDRTPLDKAGSHSHLARMVYEALEIALRSRQGEEALKEQLDIVNGVLQFIAEKTRGTFRPGETTVGQELLLSIASKTPLADAAPSIPRPLTPLSEAALLVNDGKHSLLPELLSEIASADRIALICSFIKMTGFVKMRTALREHCRKGRPLQVLTTTYLGATEVQAVEGLRELGAEVKVSYETRPTRLHAKAWLFHRDSGLGTAYVGSSNLSSAALTDGLEWNVRLPEAALSRLLQTIRSVFDRYWDDEEAGFRRYDENQKETLRAALAAAKRGGGAIRAEDVAFADFPLYRYEPTDYQRKFLKDLEIARKVRGHTRNLVVAATGTGKTVVAALDYKRLRRDDTHRCDTLLFVAHREDILRQSRATFRLALGDPTFGELLNKDHEPETGRHVFASVKALANRLRSKPPDPGYFDMIIVDEVHHAAADTYKILLNTMNPKILLGLTDINMNHTRVKATHLWRVGYDLLGKISDPFCLASKTLELCDEEQPLQGVFQVHQTDRHNPVRTATVIPEIAHIYRAFDDGDRPRFLPICASLSGVAVGDLSSANQTTKYRSRLDCVAKLLRVFFKKVRNAFPNDWPTQDPDETNLYSATYFAALIRLLTQLIDAEEQTTWAEIEEVLIQIRKNVAKYLRISARTDIVFSPLVPPNKIPPKKTGVSMIFEYLCGAALSHSRLTKPLLEKAGLEIR